MMLHEMGPQEKADRARGYLGDPFFVALLRAAEDSLIARWRQCGDPVERDELWARLQGLGLVSGILKGLVQNGDVERAIAEARKQRPEQRSLSSVRRSRAS